MYSLSHLYILPQYSQVADLSPPLRMSVRDIQSRLSIIEKTQAVSILGRLGEIELDLPLLGTQNR